MKTILLIEDDTVLSNMYNQKLTLEGFNVLVAGDGEQALDLVKENKIDLVITDIMLPRMSGVEFLEKFQKQNKKNKTPVIAWTNLSDEAEKEKAVELGVKEYLLKANVSLQEIVDLVKKYTVS